MNDTPMAVMRGASRVDRRSGRYATRSMATLRAAVVSIVRTKTSGSRVTSCQPVSVFVTPSSVNQAREMKRPSMKTSPWAKLMSSMMPYTIV